MILEFDNNKPIYLQLVEDIKKSIIKGEYKPGDKLPSVREYALLMKVNPNTMNKALLELENIKLIYTERTNGKYVTKDEKVLQKYKEKYLKEKTKEFINELTELGITKKEIENLIKGEIK